MSVESAKLAKFLAQPASANWSDPQLIFAVGTYFSGLLEDYAYLLLHPPKNPRDISPYEAQIEIIIRLVLQHPEVKFSPPLSDIVFLQDAFVNPAQSSFDLQRLFKISPILLQVFFAKHHIAANSSFAQFVKQPENLVRLLSQYADQMPQNYLREILLQNADQVKKTIDAPEFNSSWWKRILLSITFIRWIVFDVLGVTKPIPTHLQEYIHHFQPPRDEFSNTLNLDLTPFSPLSWETTSENVFTYSLSEDLFTSFSPLSWKTTSGDVFTYSLPEDLIITPFPSLPWKPTSETVFTNSLSEDLFTPFSPLPWQETVDRTTASDKRSAKSIADRVEHSLDAEPTPIPSTVNVTTKAQSIADELYSLPAQPVDLSAPVARQVQADLATFSEMAFGIAALLNAQATDEVISLVVASTQEEAAPSSESEASDAQVAAHEDEIISLNAEVLSSAPIVPAHEASTTSLPKSITDNAFSLPAQPVDLLAPIARQVQVDLASFSEPAFGNAIPNSPAAGPVIPQIVISTQEEAAPSIDETSEVIITQIPKTIADDAFSLPAQPVDLSAPLARQVRADLASFSEMAFGDPSSFDASEASPQEQLPQSAIPVGLSSPERAKVDAVLEQIENALLDIAELDPLKKAAGLATERQIPSSVTSTPAATVNGNDAINFLSLLQQGAADSASPAPANSSSATNASPRTIATENEPRSDKKADDSWLKRLSPEKREALRQRNSTRTPPDKREATEVAPPQQLLESVDTHAVTSEADSGYDLFAALMSQAAPDQEGSKTPPPAISQSPDSNNRSRVLDSLKPGDLEAALFNVNNKFMVDTEGYLKRRYDVVDVLDHDEIDEKAAIEKIKRGVILPDAWEALNLIDDPNDKGLLAHLEVRKKLNSLDIDVEEKLTILNDAVQKHLDVSNVRNIGLVACLDQVLIEKGLSLPTANVSSSTHASPSVPQMQDKQVEHRPNVASGTRSVPSTPKKQKHPPLSDGQSLPATPQRRARKAAAGSENVHSNIPVQPRDAEVVPGTTACMLALMTHASHTPSAEAVTPKGKTAGSSLKTTPKGQRASLVEKVESGPNSPSLFDVNALIRAGASDSAGASPSQSFDPMALILNGASDTAGDSPSKAFDPLALIMNGASDDPTASSPTKRSRSSALRSAHTPNVQQPVLIPVGGPSQ